MSTDRPSLPDDSEELRRWVRAFAERYRSERERVHRLSDQLAEVKQDRRRFREQCAAVWNLVRGLERLRESIPDGPEALESKCFLLKARNEELREENERLRREKRALKRQLANQRSLSDAERMVRAVARAHRRGKRWKTGADLKRWLQEWAEENAPEMPHSTSTIKRKLEEVGVWVSSGTSGHTGNAVQKTVQACLDRF